jgi:hypothetical protein
MQEKPHMLRKLMRWIIEGMGMIWRHLHDFQTKARL